jgi:DNA repair protein RadD
MIFQDRPYQKKADADIRAAFAAGYRRVLLVMPCGSGKTVVFGRIAQSAIGRDFPVLMMAHRKELIIQASSKLTGFDVQHGIIKSGIPAYYEMQIQVGSVQTIVGKLPQLRKPKLIIPDEAHHSQNVTQQTIITNYPDAKLLGVTASPIFGNGRTMGGYYDTIVMGPTVRELVDDGYLTRTLVFGPPPVADLENADYNDIEELEQRMNKRTVTGDAVQHYSAICPGEPAIVYCTTTKHCEDVAQQFREAGFKFYRIDGTMHADLRDKLLKDFDSGAIDGLCSCDLIGEGTDVPRARVAIKLAPTKVLQKHIQNDGRVSRPMYAAGFDLNTREGRLQAIAEGVKPYSIVIDCVNNLFFHGLPDDEFIWSLTEAVIQLRNGQALVPMQQCANCWLHYTPAPTCPYCGDTREIKQRKLVYTKGQLVQIKAEDKATLRQMKADAQMEKKRVSAEKKAHEEKLKAQKKFELKACKNIDDYIKFGIRHGYEDPKAWAAMKMRFKIEYKKRFAKKGG